MKTTLIIIASLILTFGVEAKTKAFERVFPLTSTDDNKNYYVLLVNTSGKDYLCYFKANNGKEHFILLPRKTISNEAIRVEGINTKFKFACRVEKIA